MRLSNLAKQFIETYSGVPRENLTIRQGVVYVLEPLGDVCILNQEAREWRRGDSRTRVSNAK